MMETGRDLTVTADGRPVTGFRHARLTGRDVLGLYTMPFTLRLWNLAEEDFQTLAAAKEISVLHRNALLAGGAVSDVYRRRTPEGTVTETVFAAGLFLWEAEVSLSVEAGVTVSDTVRRILEASGTGIRLLSFPGRDPVPAPGLLRPGGGMRGGGAGGGLRPGIPSRIRAGRRAGGRNAGLPVPVFRRPG